MIEQQPTRIIVLGGAKDLVQCPTTRGMPIAISAEATVPARAARVAS